MTTTTPGVTADAPSPLVVNDNGGWCWFQDERTLADPASGLVLIGSVASRAGRDGDRRGGDIDLTVVDPADGSSQVVTLHAGLESDDHDNPALWRRADGRWVAVYSRHKGDEHTRWRVTEDADPTRWGPERSFRWTPLFGTEEEAPPFTPGRGVTYQNIHPLGDRLLCFVRAVNDDPCYLVSADDGETWEFGGRLLTRPKIGYVNGYARYASGTHLGDAPGARDRIDLIITEHHPRDYPTSIVHGYLQDGCLHRADGGVVGELGRGVEDPTPRAEDLTPVFANGTVVDGTVLTHAWTTDLRRGADGTLAALFTARADDTVGARDDGILGRRRAEDPAGPIDHRILRAVLRPGEENWRVRELARMDTQLMLHEEDYTGLGAIDPDDLDALWISTPIDPRDGSRLAHHEIFHGRTADDGESWTWTPVTEGSSAANLRPIAVPGDPSRRIVTWYRGTMDSSQDYDAEVLVRVEPR